MYENEKLKSLILKSSYIFVIVLIIAVVILLILKYNVEGEKNMPFKLSDLILISSAEGFQDEEDSEYKWNVDIYQTNDIYLNIEKNKNFKENDAIKSIIIENLKVEKEPQSGKIEFYRPSGDEKNLFEYKDEYRINSKIEFVGSKEADIKNLKISNQGNTIMIRAVNKLDKKYASNNDSIEHSGRLLKETGITLEEIEAEISFDLIINLESDVSFKANIKQNIPIGNIANEGTISKEITNLKNIVFKRQ